MLHVKKRRKVDASAPPSAPTQVDARIIQQQLQLQQCSKNKTNTSSARLYAQLQHPQQGRLVQQQQQEQQLEVLLAAWERRCTYQPSTTERQEAFLYQGQQMQIQPRIPPVAWATSLSPSTSPNSISSLISSSSSPLRVSKGPLQPSTITRSVATSPPPLPGISTMLRIPTHPPVRQRSQSLSTNWPLSVCSPILKQKNSANIMLRLPFRRTPEPTSASLIRANSTPTCLGDDRHQNSGIATGAVSNKTSRYLREMDRREILARIEQGETQAELAKQFQVSRAAICNLNKHREDVLLRRDSNPLSRHPKRSYKNKISSSSLMAVKKNQLSQPALNGNTSSVGGMGHNIHEVASRATAQLHTRLRNRNMSMSEYQRCSERLVRLMLEEALALVPMKAVGAGGVSCAHPPCAISMESQDCGSPLLGLFRAIEPNQPAARVRITEELDQSHTKDKDAVSKPQPTNKHVSFMDTHRFPASLKNHNVFVFDVLAASADAICAVMQKLQERGAVEAMLYVVVLFINSEVIASVHKEYPSVKFVAVQIDRSGKALSFRYYQRAGCI